jgi:hypothetical protein
MDGTPTPVEEKGKDEREEEEKELPKIEPLQFMNDRSLSKPPSEEEIRIQAFLLSQSDDQGDEQANRFEARRRLLGKQVWSNDWIKAYIISLLDDTTKIRGVGEISKADEELVTKIIVFRSQWSWRLSGWEEQFGPVQVVIMEKNEEVEVHLSPKQNFHMTQIFDWE